MTLTLKFKQRWGRCRWRCWDQWQTESPS